MSIKLSTRTTTDDGVSGSTSFSHDGGSGSNRLLTVHITIIGAIASTDVTYGGVSLTKLNGVGNSILQSATWYLAGPATGTNTVIISWSLSFTGIKQMTAITWEGVDQSIPVADLQESSNLATISSISLSVPRQDNGNVSMSWSWTTANRIVYSSFRINEVNSGASQLFTDLFAIGSTSSSNLSVGSGQTEVLAQSTQGSWHGVSYSDLYVPKSIHTVNIDRQSNFDLSLRR